MAFKEEGIGFNNRSHFTNEMARFVGTEASMFSKGEDTAVGKVDDMAEKAVRMSYEKSKTEHGGLKAERKEVEAQIKTQKESLKKDEESYKEASSKLAERKEALESKIKAESQTHKSAEQKAAFDKEVKEERAKIKEQERFLDDKAAQIEEKDYKLKQTQEKKKEYKKKEDKAKKKQSAKLNAASVLKVKKDISNELGGGGANTGDAFHDGKGGLVGTFLEVINPMHYVKALLAKLGALLAPYVVIFATISIFVVVIFAILFDVLSPIVKVTEALNNIIGFFTGDDTFVNTTLDQTTIDQIVADSGCNETQEATLRFALSKVGYPYSQAQRASGNAYDCSSLAYYAWEAAGVDISGGGRYPPTASEEARIMETAGKSIDSITNLEPGDLIFYGGDSNGRYKGIYHVAIYVGNGKAVEALNTQYGVVYQKLRTKNAIMVVRPS